MGSCRLGGLFYRFMHVLALYIKRLKAEEYFYLFERGSEL